VDRERHVVPERGRIAVGVAENPANPWLHLESFVF
jgi:hypothetical protein